MKKIFYILFFSLAYCVSTAQEVLTSLRPVLPQSARPSKGTVYCNLPFVDDFSNYTGLPSALLWEPRGGAFVSQSFARYAPTIGTVTLDAYNADGNLYVNTPTTEPFAADTLTSLPIRLDSVFTFGSQARSLADSIGLSFYYMPGGGYGDMWKRIGDTPDHADSLLLEFYDAVHDQWNLVWSTAGISADSLIARTGSPWQYVYVAIDTDVYLTADFRFRFRNYCSLDNTVEIGFVENSDQWHIDYVLLTDRRQSAKKTLFDVAFVQQPPPMLQRYYAMPARQFRSSDMAVNIEVPITNLDATTHAIHDYHYRITYPDGSLLPGGDGIPIMDNIEPYDWNNSYYWVHSDIHCRFDTGASFKKYVVTHVVTGGGGDNYRSNDTMRFVQYLENYYAYDDGSAENGYGVTSQSSDPMIACRYDLHVEDTLTAVAFYFNTTRANENEQIGFYITVWEDNNGTPGRIIYQDHEMRFAKFEGLNKFVMYRLESPIVVSGTVYVGIVQSGAGIINIGFDRNSNASQYMYYNVGGAWSTSYLEGSLMMRPYFGLQASMQQIMPIVANQGLRIFPNPATATVYVDCPPASEIEIFDMWGRPVFRCQGATFSVAGWRKGCYLLKVDGRVARLLVR